MKIEGPGLVTCLTFHGIYLFIWFVSTWEQNMALLRAVTVEFSLPCVANT